MIDNVMAHPPPPPGPPPEEEAFRLEIYHYFRRNVRSEDGRFVYARQYVFRSAWYLSELEACMVQAEIKTFLAKIGMLALIESFTYWHIQKLSHVRRRQGGDQGAARVQPYFWFLRWATEGRAVSISSATLESRSDSSNS